MRLRIWTAFNHIRILEGVRDALLLQLLVLLLALRCDELLAHELIVTFVHSKAELLPLEFAGDLRHVGIELLLGIILFHSLGFGCLAPLIPFIILLLL